MNIFKKVLLFINIILFIILLFIIYYFSTCKETYYIDEKDLQIPIYTYHQIVKTSDEVEIDYMQTTYDKFQKQIDGLIKLGYTPINYQNLVDYKNGKSAIPKRSCLITFDDGYSSVYDFAYPLVKEKNIPITLFIVNNLVGTTGYMSWDQINEMKSSGLVDIYSHGLNHSEYDKLGSDILLSETEEAYSNLKEKLNDQNMLKVFAYPCGFYLEDEIETMASNGYIQNLMDGKINKSKTLDLYRLHRLYPLNDSCLKIILKQIYKSIRY